MHLKMPVEHYCLLQILKLTTCIFKAMKTLKIQQTISEALDSYYYHISYLNLFHIYHTYIHFIYIIPNFNIDIT